MSSGLSIPVSRPVVHDKQDSPLGTVVRITFDAGQRLPTHSNPSRIVISVVRGSGVIALVADAERKLVQGDIVQLEPNEPHAVAAGDDGLELLVTRVENCCGMC